jgi:hypothetical protein
VLDGLDVNRCIHLRVESVSRNVIADRPLRARIVRLLLIVATAALAKQLAKKR